MLLHSEFVEGSDVHRLAFVFKAFDLIDDIVGTDKGVHDDAADDNLEHAVSDGLLFELSLPVESFHLDFLEDSGSEFVEVGLWSPWLDLEDNEGLGNGGRLLSLLGGVSLGCECFLGLLLWTQLKVSSELRTEDLACQPSGPSLS